MRKYISILFFLGMMLPFSLQAQELQVSVNIDYNQVGQGDKLIFQEMQRAINEYLNFTEWTQDEFSYQERIRCNFRIIINQRPSADYFRCTANIQIYRPVFNSTYETPLANLSDKNFNFNYIIGQPLQYNENSYTDNLTALLNFYANLILGFDYGSFGPNGGTEYFKRAQNWVNLAASSPEQGWTSSGVTQNNRFWLAENLTNSSYRAFHSALYNYHRQGLDQMTENMPKARRSILDSLRDMQKVFRQNPLLMVVRVFLDAKDGELVKVFQGAFPNDKKVFLELMQDIDPANIEKYKKVNDG